MKKYLVGASLLLVPTGAYAADPTAAGQAFAACCSAIAACCQAVLACCG